MAYLTKANLTTHLYPEIIDEISRQDDTIIDRAITTAIGEATSYLNRYDLVQLFGTNGNAPTFRDDFFDTKIKDLAVWHIVKLANPNVNITIMRTCYEDAIKLFKDIQMGKADPAWPLRVDDPNTPNDDAGNIDWFTYPKRTNFY